MFTLDQNYLRRLVESSPDIVIAVDREGTVIYYNDGARKNLHSTSQEMTGQKVTRIYPTLDEARRVMTALREVIERKGLFCALYSDRGSHFWHTPKAGGKVDPHRLTQVGRALRDLGRLEPVDAALVQAIRSMAGTLTAISRKSGTRSNPRCNVRAKRIRPQPARSCFPPRSRTTCGSRSRT